MRTLKEARELEKAYPGKVKIMREVRYYAVTEDMRYSLYHDWTLELLEHKLWTKENE